VPSGNTATFTVIASNAQSYAWQFNGTNLVDGGRISGSASPALLIVNTLTNDAGAYSVVTANAAGSATSALATLTVLPPEAPWFVPSSLRLDANGQFQFTLAGTPGSNYTIQVSTDLRNWKVLDYLFMTNTTADFLDIDTNLAKRFYRAYLGP
jgi:hypothetical protein